MREESLAVSIPLRRMTQAELDAFLGAGKGASYFTSPPHP
jgi:hypothetical protein